MSVRWGISTVVLARVASAPSQFEVLVGRKEEPWNSRWHGILNARPDADGKAVVIDRRLDDLLVQDALELVQEFLALGAVELVGLAAEEVIHFW